MKLDQPANPMVVFDTIQRAPPDEPGHWTPPPIPEPPGLIGKAWNFASSAAKHIAAGMPQATQEQIDARFAVCQACELFDGRACTKCGCPVIREKAFLSKLSWAHEKCPVGKWGPVDTPATVAAERSDHAEKTTDGSSGEAGSSV